MIWKEETKVISVRISRIEYERIRQHCQRSGITISEFLKNAINYYLMKKTLMFLWKET